MRNDLQLPNPPQWHQINIQFRDRHRAEREAITHLGPALANAESTGILASWFFIRKPWWRLRYLPADDVTAPEANQLLAQAARCMQASGRAARWAEGIYEPETHAFGGEEAMAAAHDLFHADSRHIFQYLRSSSPTALNGEPTDRSKRRELSLLLCAALMRAAGLDRYEQGDIWAKVAQHRTTENKAPPQQWRTFTAATQRLITVDTSPDTALRTSGPLEFAADWLTAFEQAGKTLIALSDEGQLTRGIRAVIAHHIIFHWNRIGLPSQAQAHMALAAKDATFEDRQHR